MKRPASSGQERPELSFGLPEQSSNLERKATQIALLTMIMLKTMQIVADRLDDALVGADIFDDLSTTDAVAEPDDRTLPAAIFAAQKTLQGQSREMIWTDTESEQRTIVRCVHRDVHDDLRHYRRNSEKMARI
jgi:hypothetical protein